MASNHEHEFLSLAPPNMASDDESSSSPISSIRPHLDTLFAEFSRTRSRLSRSPPPRLRRRYSPSSRLNVPGLTDDTGAMDLRSLEYVAEYDPHLMCPICHVPFISPVVLECDHTFCASCYDQYRQSNLDDRQEQCPTCRINLEAGPRKASRLVTNMCNDLKVRCPNEYCEETLPRGCVEQHTSRDCAEEKLDCPDSACARLTKRKNFVADRCLHTSHVECDCGELIELGRGDWLKHKDDECPKTTTKCEQCGERMSRSQSPSVGPHRCREKLQKCPGADFGCAERFEPAELDAHAGHCAMARMAPFLQKQARLLSSLQEQLSQAQVRNDILETGLDKIRDVVSTQHHHHSESESASTIESIEEVERTHSPLPHHHQHSMLLPAHLRALTPSPDPSSQQHLLALHESLRQNVATLEHEVGNLSAGLADLDARTSMQIMNETLRIKEDLAHANAALFSTRAQVGWLLNRERVGQQMGVRGRTGGSATGTGAAVASSSSAPVTLSEAEASGTISSMLGASQRGTRRPSGGSQERVKL